MQLCRGQFRFEFRLISIVSAISAISTVSAISHFHFRCSSLPIIMSLQKQFIVAASIAFIIFVPPYIWMDLPLPASLGTVDKLVYALRWCLFMTMVLMWGFAKAGQARRYSAASDPLSGNDHLIQLQKNFLTNSLEQFIIAAIPLLVLSTYLETMAQMKIIPLFAINFIVARILFHLGYPERRGIGMIMTFFPSLFVSVADVYFMVTKGFSFPAIYIHI